MLFFDSFQIRLSRGNIFFGLHFHFFGLVIENDQVTVSEIKAVQFIARLLRIQDVFIDNVGCSLRGIGGSGSNLAYWTKFAKEIEEGGAVNVVGKVLDEEDAVRFRGELVGSRHIESIGAADKAL
jgi:hypothetical protein